MKIVSDSFTSQCVEEVSGLLTPVNVIIGLVAIGVLGFLLGLYLKHRRAYITTLISAADGVPITNGEFRLKLCSQCMRGYMDSSLNYCLHDGARLDENITAQVYQAPETLLLPTLPDVNEV